MTNPAGAEVRCECGKILATPTLTPASLLLSNKLHRQTILLTPTTLSVRGCCPGCSKVHTLTYATVVPEQKPRRTRAVRIIGQLSLF